MATITMTETETGSLDPSQWTTPQELSLLQSITRYKPVGIHRHFRMICILDSLLTSGTIPLPYTDHSHASSTAGIWRKLGSLYDLKALDEREDVIFADVPADDEDGVVEYWREFELLGYDFQARMWECRLAETEELWSDDEGLPEMRLRESTIADSDDMRSSPVGSVRGTRTSGRRTAVGKRLAEVKQEESPVAGSGKGSRRTSKAASPSVKDEDDVEMRDADQDDDEESDDEEDESDQDDTEDDNRKGRSVRGRGGRRGTRGRRGRRGK